MYVRQGDIFWGMEKDFVKKATDLAVGVSCRDGDHLFATGDEADHFYILLRGKVALAGEVNGQKPYIAEEPGEVIGWSALIRRQKYAATATCHGGVELLKVEREPFLKVLDQKPESKIALFERLAGMLGNSLLELRHAAT